MLRSSMNKQAATFTITDNMGKIHRCYALQRKHLVKGGLKLQVYFDTTTFSVVYPAAGLRVFPHE